MSDGLFLALGTNRIGHLIGKGEEKREALVEERESEDDGSR